MSSLTRGANGSKRCARSHGLSLLLSSMARLSALITPGLMGSQFGFMGTRSWKSGRTGFTFPFPDTATAAQRLNGWPPFVPFILARARSTSTEMSGMGSGPRLRKQLAGKGEKKIPLARFHDTKLNIFLLIRNKNFL